VIGFKSHLIFLESPVLNLTLYCVKIYALLKQGDLSQMSLKIPIETSARHIHVSEKDFKKLFGEDASLHYVHELSQPGQYLCQERITVVGPRGRFENVAILGPYRKETQIELSMTDTRKIGLPGIIRQSGHTDGTPGCKLVGPKGTIELEKGVIVAKRHIHMTPLEASRAHVKDNDEVFVITQSYERGLIFADVVVRVSPTFKLSMHVDTDEANAFANDDSPTGAILKLFDGTTYSLEQWADEVASGINR
jgi:propanediol utilization protein